MRSSEGGSDEQLPRKFDRYDLLKKLATGGMAEIFLAKQSGLEGFEKVVVLKRILPHLAQDEEFVSMFLDEARIAAKLSHPNVVQIYDLGKADGTYYIAMEYVSGRNCQHLLAKAQSRGETIPVEHVCRVVAGVCDGLHYAHSRKDYDGTPLNIVHRDISPQNVLVSFAGGVKVVDFGIAKASTQLAQTRAGVLKGKYAYMSPEQVRGAKIDHRSDVFAVGLVMYEMLTGVRAFERDSSLKTLKAIVQEKPLNPRELNPEVPMEVVKLLSKALEKNPDRRYKTAQEMQLAIEDYLESSPKKSNNVRLSRYMYDIFDDELNSKDGTMVVKGIGEVIIPASQGVKLVPKVEEEIDHKTLSAALQPAPNPDKGNVDDPSAGGVRVVRSEKDGKKESAAQAAAPKPSPPKAEPSAKNTQPQPPIKAAPDTGVDDDDDDDGKTIPVYDIEEHEKKRAERAAGGPQKEADARAAALLAKVDAIAASPVPTKTSAPATTKPPAASNTEESAPTRFDGPRKNDDMPRQESMIVGPNGRIESSGRGIRPQAKAAGPDDDPSGIDAQTSDTPPPGTPRSASRAQAPAPPPMQPERSLPRAPQPGQRQPAMAPHAGHAPAKLPPIIYATAIATIALVIMSIVSIIIFFFVMSPGEEIEYGLVSVVTEPAGAEVFIDGESVGKAPAQASMPRDDKEHTIEAKLDGHKPLKQTFAFGDKDFLELPKLKLEEE